MEASDGCDFCRKRKPLQTRGEAYEGILEINIIGDDLDAYTYLPGEGRVVANALMPINYCPCCGRELRLHSC